MYAVGELSSDIRIDPGIVFSAVSYQDEFQSGIRIQQVDNLLLFMGFLRLKGAIKGGSEVPEQDGSLWEIVDLQKQLEVLVQVPWAVTEVEYRILLMSLPSRMQGLVEPGSPFQGKSPVGIPEKRIVNDPPLEERGYTGMKYGIVNIADHSKSCSDRWNKQFSLKIIAVGNVFLLDPGKEGCSERNPTLVIRKGFQID